MAVLRGLGEAQQDDEKDRVGRGTKGDDGVSPVRLAASGPAALLPRPENPVFRTHSSYVGGDVASAVTVLLRLRRLGEEAGRQLPIVVCMVHSRPLCYPRPPSLSQMTDLPTVVLPAEAMGS